MSKKKIDSGDPYNINAKRRNKENELAKLNAELQELEAMQLSHPKAQNNAEFKNGGKLPEYFVGGLISAGVGTVAGLGARKANMDYARYLQEQGMQPLEEIDPIYNPQQEAALGALDESRGLLKDFGKYDISDRVRDINRSAAIQRANVRNLGAATGAGGALSGFGAAAAQRNADLARAYGEKARYEDTALGQKAQMIGSLGMQQAQLGQATQQADLMAQQLNMQQEANQQAYLDAAKAAKAAGSQAFAQGISGAGKDIGQSFDMYNIYK